MAAASAAGCELLLYFAHRQELSNFREQELQSCASACGTEVTLLGELPNDQVFVRARFASPEAARAVCQRSVLLHGAYELWGEGAGYEELCADLREHGGPFVERYRSSSFKYILEVVGHSYTFDEKVERFNKFSFLGLEGKVEMQDPDILLVILEDWGTGAREQALRRVYYARRFALGARGLLDRYTLKRRAYIGTTTMIPELCFVMANQARVRKGAWVWDPFCGTGSTLVSAAHFGAAVWGSDLDGRSLGTPEKGILSNCKQYGFTPAELMRLDISKRAMWRAETLDAIICDPPYGRRESRKKIDSEKQERIDAFVEALPEEGRAKRSAERRQHYVPPPKEDYRLEDLFSDLVDIAAKVLVVGGRLVYWHPTSHSYDPAEVPSHPCLQLVSDLGQSVTIKLKRRLITLEKVRQWREEDRVVPGQTPAHDGFHPLVEPHESAAYKSYAEKRDKRRQAVEEHKRKVAAGEKEPTQRLSKAERRQQQLEQAARKAAAREEKQRANHEQMRQRSARLREEKERAEELKRAKLDPGGAAAPQGGPVAAAAAAPAAAPAGDAAAASSGAHADPMHTDS
eukprot:TRINITY_DN52023_c0_g1_i1.p1 TRINITY_DN52023_c0_g1~~TRINITY_DN52023_c0_g1_i1.p1  ORF type:complete len:597 (+),score=186.64 TRINITY_DN52023_c0_g1_i1:73-1791(+)